MRLRDYLARRVLGYLAIVIVAALLSLCGIGRVYAATQCPNDPYRCSQAEAFDDSLRQGQAAGAKYCVAPSYAGVHKVDHPTAYYGTAGKGYYGTRFMCKHASSGLPTNSWSYLDIAFAHFYNDCFNRADVQEANQPTGALRCKGGCVHQFVNDPTKKISIGVSTGLTCRPDTYTCPTGFKPGGSIYSSLDGINCIPDNPDCPAGETKVNGVCKRTEQCPEGQVQDEKGMCVPKKSECPAGQVKGPDGSCVNDTKCPEGQTRGKDGSCKKDSDGDGEPDAGEDDGKFSGGDTCDEPPQCSGDNILCGQARIQWRIDCNTRKNSNISGGACNAVPICTGEKCDAIEYSQLLQQWRATCALERLAGNVSGNPGTPANDYTLPDTAVGSGGTAGGAGHPDVTGLFTESDLASQIGSGGDASGFGLPRSCPLLTLPPLEFLGGTMNIPWDKICLTLQILSAMILLAGHIQWAFIVGKIGS